MQKLSNLDYYFLVEELQELVGSRLNKVYELSKEVLRFRFSKEGTQYNLLAELGVRAHLTKYLEEVPKNPSNFAMFLRKHLDNARVTKVEQLNFDRIFAVHLQKKEEFILVFEMFAKGNLLLCDSNFEIILPYRKEQKGERKLAARTKFELPQSNKVHPKKASVDDAKDPSAINLAPFYLKELQAHAEGSSEKLTEELHEVFNRFSPTVYLTSGKPVAFSAVELANPVGQVEKFETISKALDEYYFSVQGAQEKVAPKTDGLELRKLEKSLEQQKLFLQEHEAKAKEFQEKGDAIYLNFEKAEKAILKARKEGVDKVELKL
ncbi:MAG: NFACT family protein [Candidatus Micrarchaeia archaeon]